jgi:hypothetical protein
MASQTDVANLCLSILGKPSIASLLDNSNAARVINIEYDLLRKGLLNGRSIWRFSVKRASLPSLTGKPVSGPYSAMYAFPSDCIRLLQVGDTWPGLDMSDYRLGPTDADYSVEGGMLLCDYGSPLSLVYVADVTDTTMMDPNFIIYFAANLAYSCCERLQGSDAKQKAALARMGLAMTQATASNALINPPQQTADDSWVAARMQ